MPTPEAARPPVPAPSDVVTAKAALRARVRAARRVLDPERRAHESAAAAAHLWTWLGPRIEAVRADGEARPVVGTVLPLPTEPDTAPLRARLWEAGARVMVPVTEPERRLSWAQWHPEVEVARAAGLPIDEPVGPRHDASVLHGAAALVLPGLAVDGAGMRLGQGGGYYDRMLAALPARVPRVAFVFSHEVLPAGAVPVEATDAPVHGVVTADGLRWFTPPAEASAAPSLR